MKGANILQKILSQNLKKNIKDTITWMDSGEYIKFELQRNTRLSEFFEETELKETLTRNGETCYRNSEDLIHDIYERGARQGYREIQQDRVFTDRDKTSLNHLLNYDYRLITSVNKDHINNIRDSLITGIIEGKHPFEMAKDIRETQDLQASNGLSPTARSIMIARTEASRALNTGTINAYRNYGISMVDWVSAGDDSVCEDCAEMENNNPHNIEDIEMPLHPNCRCTIRAHIID